MLHTDFAGLAQLPCKVKLLSLKYCCINGQHLQLLCSVLHAVCQGNACSRQVCARTPTGPYLIPERHCVAQIPVQQLAAGQQATLAIHSCTKQGSQPAAAGTAGDLEPAPKPVLSSTDLDILDQEPGSPLDEREWEAKFEQDAGSTGSWGGSLPQQISHDSADARPSSSPSPHVAQGSRQPGGRLQPSRLQPDLSRMQEPTEPDSAADQLAPQVDTSSVQQQASLQAHEAEQLLLQPEQQAELAACASLGQQPDQLQTHPPGGSTVMLSGVAAAIDQPETAPASVPDQQPPVRRSHPEQDAPSHSAPAESDVLGQQELLGSAQRPADTALQEPQPPGGLPGAHCTGDSRPCSYLSCLMSGHVLLDLLLFASLKVGTLSRSEQLGGASLSQASCMQPAKCSAETAALCWQATSSGMRSGSRGTWPASTIASRAWSSDLARRQPS